MFVDCSCCLLMRSQIREPLHGEMAHLHWLMYELSERQLVTCNTVWKQHNMPNGKHFYILVQTTCLQKKIFNPKSTHEITKKKKKKKMRDETASRQFPDRWFSEYSTSLLSAKMSLFVLWYLSELKDVPLHTEVSWLSLFHKMNHWSESRWAYKVFYFLRMTAHCPSTMKVKMIALKK